MWHSDCILKGNDPKLSFIVSTSRDWVFDTFRRQMLKAEMPYSQTELIVLLDSKSEALREKWLELLRLMRIEKPWNGIYLYTTGRPALHDTFLVHLRRERIIDLKEISKSLIGKTQFIYCLEDDTFAPDNAYFQLAKYLTKDKVLIEGVQAGRWGLKMVGVWEIEEENGQPVHVRTLLPGQGVQPIQGAGFYCYVTYTELYKAATYRYEGDCWGPDVCFCYDLVKQGMHPQVNWDVRCGHLSENQGMIFPDKDIVSLEWHNFDGQWKMKREKP